MNYNNINTDNSKSTFIDILVKILRFIFRVAIAGGAGAAAASLM